LSSNDDETGFSVRQRRETSRGRAGSGRRRKAYRDFTPKEQREDKSIKQDIAQRARAQSAEGSITAAILSAI
jgi:hypothetical protein